MVRILLSLLLALLPSAACIWDRDTLRDEAKGKLDTVKAITGWFDRYPAKYYEMRLARVTEELKAKPDVLDLYDDAGVACSRLGRHDESIAWMEKKKVVLDSKSPDETKEERYRYLSNIGTFHLIRWITLPEQTRSSDLTDLKTSETFIAEALELNPDAHFGREKFQLMWIRWLLCPAPSSKEEMEAFNFLGIEGQTWTGRQPMARPEGFTLEDARKGITGLIQLGAAWESVDAFHALQRCLDTEESAAVGFLSYLREVELYKEGARSFHPSAEVRHWLEPSTSTISSEAGAVSDFFPKARAAAKEREATWIAYQGERFAKGMHPDTHPDFWKDWREPEFPKMPGRTFDHFVRENTGLVFLGVAAMGVSGLIVLILVIKRFSGRKRKSVSC